MLQFLELVNISNLWYDINDFSNFLPRSTLRSPAIIIYSSVPFESTEEISSRISPYILVLVTLSTDIETLKNTIETSSILALTTLNLFY